MPGETQKNEAKYENTFRKKTLYQDYLIQMLSVFKKLYPDMEPTKLRDLLVKGIITHYQPKKVTLDESNLMFPENISEVTIKDLDDILVKDSPIISGSGTIYKRQDQVENDRAGMIETFAANRSVAKKHMFEHLNDEDQSLHDGYFMEQWTWKIMNNSYYGVLNEKNSQFYDTHSGTSVTSSGVDIITTAINLFEKFLANNIYFYSMDDIYNYTTRIRKEVYKDDLELSWIDSEEIKGKYSVDSLYTYLTNFLHDDYTPDDTDKAIMMQYLSSLTEEQRKRIYYKNNLLEFFSDSDIIDRYLKDILGRLDFLDPNEPPADMQERLDQTWSLLQDWILYNYQDFHRFHNASERKRKAVLLTDTDSNFVYLDPIISKLEELYPDKVISSDRDSVICTVNIIMYQLQKATKDVMYKLQKESGVPDSHASIVSLKNEFLSLKIMLTNNKKQYAQIITLQEGNRLDTPKLDLKGLSIRKVSTNKKVADKFTDILEGDILNTTDISYSDIIRNYKGLEGDIYDSLMNGELTYTLPSKANPASTYKNAFSIQAYKSVYVWNELFPNKEITLPNKIKLVKTNIPNFDAVKENPYIEEDSDIYNAFRRLFANKDLIGGTGINAIAIGTEEQSIPEVLRPFIDIETMIINHMKNGIVLLESIGVQPISVNSTSQITSNLINL